MSAAITTPPPPRPTAAERACIGRHYHRLLARIARQARATLHDCVRLRHWLAGEAAGVDNQEWDRVMSELLDLVETHTQPTP
jgi:hypothetical protein